MELALNLGWLGLTILLGVGCLWADRAGRLRLPLRLALGCAFLLAMLLFPAISMTDDLQRSNAEVEMRVRMHSLAELASLPSTAELLPLLLFALLFAGAVARTRLLWLTLPRERRGVAQDTHVLALAVRPPTFA